MNKEEIYFMPAYELRDMIKRQEKSSQEITEMMIERIGQINPKLNAFCTPTFELARDAAKEADEAIKKGGPLGLLHGIPISIKDESILILNSTPERIVFIIEFINIRNSKVGIFFRFTS